MGLMPMMCQLHFIYIDEKSAIYHRDISAMVSKKTDYHELKSIIN